MLLKGVSDLGDSLLVNVVFMFDSFLSFFCVINKAGKKDNKTLIITSLSHESTSFIVHNHESGKLSSHPLFVITRFILI